MPDGVVRRASGLLAAAARDFASAWRLLAKTDVLYKAIAFAVLTPLTGLLMRYLVTRTGSAAVADADIALFFFTTRVGSLALILISALALAIVALEQACLMTIGLGMLRGARLRLRDAFVHATTRAFAVLRLTLHIVLRVLVLSLPFVAVIGLVYFVLLRDHDINYYLTGRPPEFRRAVALAGVTLVALAALLLRKASGWVLALPIVVFEKVLPVFALGTSAKRMAGRRTVAALALAVWAVLAVGLPLGASVALRAAGRAAAPAFGHSVPTLLLFMGLLGLVWLVLAVAVGVFTTAYFSLLVVRLYDETGAEAARLPAGGGDLQALGGGRFNVSWRGLTGGVAIAVLASIGFFVVVYKLSWTDRTVLVIAHRGASAEAPENTLAAFRLAADEGTDFVELDVQESADGVVLVNHDKDLMKTGRSPLKVWESTAEQLRAVDIGSHKGPQFARERVPTLAEALDACKGRARVDIELKSYGHDERLEERVVELVEAAGMADAIVTMSLDHGMVRKMKSLRPHWKSGILTAKAVGNLTRLPADFLAVEAGMATRRFVRSAHLQGKDVYIWSVNDPSKMFQLIGRGVDGIITDKPGLAREVIERYARMTQAERLLFVLLVGLGAKEDVTAPEGTLRP